MSNPTHDQAAHTLKLIGDQNPTIEHLRKLHDGYLSALVKAVVQGNLPSLVDFKKFIGLASLPTVTSDGRTGVDFIRIMKEKGYNLSDWAQGVLRGDAFNTSVTSGVTYTPVMILGSEFTDEERITRNIRAEANRRKYITPPAELAPILRETLTDEELKVMGLYWLTVMHEPITDSGGHANLLVLSRNGDGRRLGTAWDDPDHRWLLENGFVFLAPQDQC